jgi:hypothetical protein
LIFLGNRARQWFVLGKPTFIPHRGRIDSNLEKGTPLKITLELVLSPEIGSGRHDVSGLEVKRISAGKRKYD